MANEECPDPIKSEQRSPDADDFDIHRQIVLWLFVFTIVFVGFATFALIQLDQDNTKYNWLSILPMVALAGLLGAFVSALQRLYSASDMLLLKHFRGLLKGANLYIVAYSSIPPLVGFISAVVLYLVFASSFFMSPLFPAFGCEQGYTCTDFHEVLRHWKPVAATDYVKSIVWGFIAGFFERVVPDILNRIATTGTSER